MNREKAIQLWELIYGKDVLWAIDCFGTWMYKDDYADTNKKRLRPNGTGKMYNYGWEVDHIRPKNDFKDQNDADFENNYEIMYWNNNREKSDSYPQFKIGNKSYKVVKCIICQKNGLVGYGIENEKGFRIDWKGKQNSYIK